MCRCVCVPAAWLALLTLTLVVSRSQSCPRSCNCYQANEVHCTFRSLLNVPPGLPAHTRRMNLGFNSISRLHDRSLAGLKKVELLMLHSNDLHHLPDGVFRDMKSLQILKLSYNKLREISSSLTFSGLTSLLRLYLDHNLLQHIHPRALLQLPSLRLLRLQGNKLHQLHPHALCTLSLLNTYYFSTLRNLDLSNNSLTILPKDSVATAPLLESLALQGNPWSCDCRMDWFFTWSLTHQGAVKCLTGPQCPVCAAPTALQGEGLLDQTALSCSPPFIHSSGKKETPQETDLTEIPTVDAFRQPLGRVSLGLSDQQGNSVDLVCNITHSTDSQHVTPPPDLSLTSSSPLPLVLSLSLECPIEGQSYEKLWRILAYYSETAAHLEREIMLSKAPALAYRYRQSAEMDGYYHTAVKASVRARPHWLLQPAISIRLNRAQSNKHKVQLIFLTRVSAHPDPTSQLSTSSPSPHPWVLIATNRSTTALAAVAGSKVELSCPLLSSDNSKVQWFLPDGSKLISPSRSIDGRLQASSLGLTLKKVQLSDAGIYYCLASAGRDTDVLPVRLAVEESSVPHSEELIGPPVSGTVGEAVSLSCKISGSPQPCMSWILPDGTIVRQGVAVSGGLKIHSNGSLSLPRPSLRDTGHYRCIGVNEYGSDSLSMHLKLNIQHIPPHKNSFPRRPQSAAGRSTKIRAPLFHQLDEGSGDEEEQEEQRTPIGNRRNSISRQPHSDRLHPVGTAQRHGPVRGGLPRRGGGPSPEQRRVRLQNRHRVSTNRQRIDPQKWADLLAKIRQKTANISNNQPMPTGNPTAGPTQRTQDKETRVHEEGDTNRGRAQEAGLEVEAEGSSVDDVVLQEEHTEPIQPGHGDTEAKTEIKKDAETENSTETPIENQTHTKTETDRQSQTENVGPQTGTAERPVKQREQVTSNPMSGANEIALELGKGHEQGANLKPNRSKPQSPQQGLFPNLIPQSRPQSPWNSRRRIGQQRRINRPRLRPVTPTQPFPYHVNTRSQTMKPDSTTNQISVRLIMPTSTTPVYLLTTNDNIQSAPNTVTLSTNSSHVSDTPVMSYPNSASPSLIPFPTSTYTDLMTYSRYHKIAQTEESTFDKLNRPTPTLSNSVTSETHDPDSYDRTFTHDLQTHTETQTALANNAERPTSKHSEELDRNVSGESHFSIPHSFSVSSVPSTTATTTTAAEILSAPSTAPERASNAGKNKSTSTFITIQDRLSTTYTKTAISRTTSTLTGIVIPTSSSARHTSSAITSTTGTTASTTSTFPPITSITSTSTTTSIPITYTSNATTEPGTSTRRFTGSFNDNPSISNPFSTSLPTNTKTTTLTATTPGKHFPTTSTKFTYSTLPSTTTTMTPISTKASTAGTSTVGQVDHGGRLVSRVPNQSGPPTDWKNPGANSIPDSHSSRSPLPPSSSLPAAPGAPFVRSRPRIADPHIRTVSSPAGSTARLACEAQGMPKPSITWTKVATGAVMSIHSRVQRFEVLPNGTLVIQNVQLQDRGTYICSANSFLGRDRLLTSLEVWTRPPRMQLATYREVIIHQGGEVHLECQADGVPTPLLSWVLPDRSTLTSTGSSSSRISMDSNGTLHIPAALPTDRGAYRCIASNSAGTVSASVRVHVSSLPPVIHQPREENLLLSPGRPLYIHCSARGAPPPILRWQIPDGTLVRPSQFVHGNLFVLPNGTLHIRKVGPKDTGSYECAASNGVGTNVRTVRVVVEGGTEIERRRGETINEGPKEVSSEVKPPPNKDRTLGIPFNPSNPSTSANFSPLYPPDRSRSVQELNPPNSSSNFAPKIYETDIASPTDFTNIKRTNFPSLSSSSNLLTNNTKVSPSINNTGETSSLPVDRKASAVLKPLPISPFTKARIISTSPSTSTVHYGGTLQLHCSVTGNPMPIIIWRNPNRKLVDMHYSFDRRMKVHPNGTLSVQAITEKDAGDYLCIARNKVADDYRLLRVSVATKPAKIEPRQPLNHMVSFGKPLKVDCQASGLPHPVVHWSLPDGTMLNSVLHEEERVVRAQRPTVFDNGTLLVPVAGMGEEGEYTCYAKNQGGQDTMKVKVKVMTTTPPRFTLDRSHSVVKLHQGATATIPCQAIGDPVPTVTWFSPALRVIPQSRRSGLYSERVVVASGGSLQIHSAQRIDTGNYTCRATNSAGETSMVVSLEVETSTHGLGGQLGGRQWSTNEQSRGQGITLGDRTNNARIIGSGIPKKVDKNNSSSNSFAGTNGRTTSSHPALRSNNQNGFNRQFSESSPAIDTGVSRQQSIGSGADSTGNHRKGPSLTSSSNSLGISHSTDRVNSGASNSGTNNNNEVIAGRTGNDANSSRDNNRLSFNSRLFSNGASTSTFRGNSLSKNSNLGGTSDSRRKSDGSSGNFDTDVGMVTTMKQQAVKGQTVLLPCPSQGFPPHRLAWLLPGNGMLPAPYYGSRFTVHRNGSLELRAVRGSDSGTLACVVRSERGETLIRVQLEVSEPEEESRSLGQERLHTGSLLSPAQSFRSESPFLQLQRGLSSPVTPRPVKPPPPAGSGSERIVSTRTAPLVSTINGETLRLSCTVSQTQGSLSWTMPSGKVLSRGESGDSGRYVVHQDGTLIVEQASVFDRGTYTCKSFSNDSSSVLVVTVPVIVIAYPPRITKGPSPATYTHSGVAVELPCLTIATPRATVTWESPDRTQLTVMNQARIYGNRYLSPHGSLVIQNPTHRDTGFYRCTAKNVIGVDSKETYLHVI
ncbi:immunoglobulin superfamily member 10-like [Cololabis saira]|uniref:immunoglobulin superfamily member 10-like n=1 Tax=Cololabis saira TaxID=129043 RepID=UPI002AD44572|nr:immunoglobulin superfamily member 10-like [Cololabis saira]